MCQGGSTTKAGVWNLYHQTDGKGEAGVSCSMLHACGTALACKPVCALQGEAGVSCSMLHACGTALPCNGKTNYIQQMKNPC